MVPQASSDARIGIKLAKHYENDDGEMILYTGVVEMAVPFYKSRLRVLFNDGTRDDIHVNELADLVKMFQDIQKEGGVMDDEVEVRMDED